MIVRRLGNHDVSFEVFLRGSDDEIKAVIAFMLEKVPKVAEDGGEITEMIHDEAITYVVSLVT